MVNKKGELSSEFVFMIRILMFTLVILAVLGVVFVKELNKNEDIELCKLSIIAASYGKLLDGNKRIDFNCERRPVEITKSDVQLRSHISEELILHRIAEEMRICKYMTNEGRSNPFKQYRAFESQACLICAEVTFDEKLREAKADGDVSGTLDLMSHLESNTIPDSDVKYIDYLESSNENQIEYKKIEDIDVDTDYYIVYSHIQSGKWFDDSYLIGRLLSKPVKWVSDYEGGGIYSSAIIVLDQDKIEELGCEFIAN